MPDPRDDRRMFALGRRRLLQAGLVAGGMAAAGWPLRRAMAAGNTSEPGQTPPAPADAITSHGISPFGQLKYGPDFTNFDYANPKAPKGGTMSFRGTGASNTFDSLNPFILEGVPAQGLGKIYDTLMIASADEPGAVYGLLAKSITYPEDRSWAEFALRPQAHFSDGVPLTAEDVVFTFETLKAKGQPYYQILLRPVVAVDALSSHRVRFTFDPKASTRDLAAEVGQIEILPRHYYDKVDFSATTLTPPVGSGPYNVDKVDAGRSIQYTRNHDYWGAKLPVNVGANNFDRYVYQYFTDLTAAFEALKVGEYLFHEEYSSAIWATGYDFPALTKGWVKRETLPDHRPNGTQGYWFNLRRPVMKDVRVREALAVMFNFEWSNASLFHGLYERTVSFWQNTDMIAEGVPQGDELKALEPFRDRLPATIFTEPAYVPPVESKTSQTDRGALHQASALLDAAGWKVGSDGMRRNAQGEKLTVVILDDNPAFQKVNGPYVDNLHRAGVDARYEQVDPAQMQVRQKRFDYDITPGRLVMNMTPSAELRTLFGSQSASAAGTLNFSGVSDPVVDALIEQVIAADSRPQLVARVRALDRVLRSMQIWAPNWYRPSYWLAYWDVFGRPDVQPPYDRGTDWWWTDQDKLDRIKSDGGLRG